MAKLLRGNVGVYAAYPEACANWNAPTSTELNNTNMVFDISCAIEDGMSLNLTGSETDDSITICDTAQVSTPTLKNYEASLDGFRDVDPTASGAFNQFFELFKAKNIPFYLIKRVGVAQGTSFASGQVISTYYVKTDNPINILERNSPALFGARFKPQGSVNFEYELAS